MAVLKIPCSHQRPTVRGFKPSDFAASDAEIISGAGMIGSLSGWITNVPFSCAMMSGTFGRSDGLLWLESGWANGARSRGRPNHGRSGGGLSPAGDGGDFVSQACLRLISDRRSQVVGS